MVNEDFGGKVICHINQIADVKKRQTCPALSSGLSLLNVYGKVKAQTLAVFSSRHHECQYRVMFAHLFHA